MFNRNKTALFLMLAILNFGCTKLAPELGFGNLDSSSDSLTLESNVKIINTSNSSTDLALKGNCESNMNLFLTAKDSQAFKCVNLSYAVQISSRVLPEGLNIISIESYDDAKNKMGSKQIQVFKDTIAPTVTISGPAVIPGVDSSILLSGTCSESGQSVTLTEIGNKSTEAGTCVNGNWSTSFTIEPGRMNQASFSFFASQTDSANNKSNSATIIVIKTFLGEFSITGVRHSATATYSDVLKSTLGSIHMEWTASAGAATYNVKIQKIGSAGAPAADQCYFVGIAATNLTKVIATYCAGITPGNNYRLLVEARDATNQNGYTKTFPFRTKPAAALQANAEILYVNSNFGVSALNSIDGGEFVLDADSTGPHTFAVVDSGGLGSQLSVNNSSAPYGLTVTPAADSSGVFTITIAITDQYGLVSAPLSLKIAIVYPFSWAGLIDNDFNKPGNWCGTAGLKTGCSGGLVSLGESVRTMIDNLCSYTRPSSGPSYCSPVLTSNTIARSIYLKSNSLVQGTYSMTIGTISDNGEPYLKVTGGQYNDANSTGSLYVYNELHVLGGLLNAPKNGVITTNTRNSDERHEFIKITDPSFFNHNNSTLTLEDPYAGNFTQYLVFANGLRLKNLKINTTGGLWTLKSTNLILDGDLTMSGVLHSGYGKPMLIPQLAGNKITLNGNLKCEGDFGGGTLPIFVTSASATYKSTYAGCKMPPLQLQSGTSLKEHAESSQNLVLQSLNTSTGSFTAPESPRSTIFRPEGLANNSIIVDLTGTFDSNNGHIDFETSDDYKNYKINLSTVNSVAFSNPNNKTSSFEIYSDFTTKYFSFLGDNAIHLLGLTRTVTAEYLWFAAGMDTNAARLSKIVLAASSSPADITVNTTSRLNLPIFEMLRSTRLTGSSALIDWSGAQISLNSFNLTVPGGKALNYNTKSGSGSIIGSKNGGQL